jgi:hypothetical protein
MLGIHKVTVSLLLAVGPFRFACHAHATDGKGMSCAAETWEVAAAFVEDDDDDQTNETRSLSMSHVSHRHARTNASSCETRTSAPG